MGGGGRGRGQGIEPVTSRTPTQPDVVLLDHFLVLVNLLRQLAENVINLLVDGQKAAP